MNIPVGLHLSVMLHAKSQIHLLFYLVTSQLLDESRLTNKSGASESGMALFGTTSKKRKFNPTSSTSMRGKMNV